MKHQNTNGINESEVAKKALHGSSSDFAKMVNSKIDLDKILNLKNQLRATVIS